MTSAITARNPLAKRNPFATPVFQLAAILRLFARGVHTAAMRLNAWLERRRAITDARLALEAMSDRELRDIGLTRFDVQMDFPTRDGHSSRDVDE